MSWIGRSLRRFEDPALLLAPAAVVNAIVDALSPLRIEIYEMPVTPRRIRELLRAREEQAV